MFCFYVEQTDLADLMKTDGTESVGLVCMCWQHRISTQFKQTCVKKVFANVLCVTFYSIGASFIWLLNDTICKRQFRTINNDIFHESYITSWMHRSCRRVCSKATKLLLNVLQNFVSWLEDTNWLEATNFQGKVALCFNVMLSGMLRISLALLFHNSCISIFTVCSKWAYRWILTCTVYTRKQSYM